MKVTVCYTDESEANYDCNCINYFDKAAFLETKDGERLCIPYNNVYIIREEAEREVTT